LARGRGSEGPRDFAAMWTGDLIRDSDTAENFRGVASERTGAGIVVGNTISTATMRVESTGTTTDATTGSTKSAATGTVTITAMGMDTKIETNMETGMDMGTIGSLPNHP